MFEKFRQDPQVAAALKPIEVHAPELAKRCINYVRDGADPAVLLELQQRPVPHLEELLLMPGRLTAWYWSGANLDKELKTLGLSTKQVRRDRSEFYNGKNTTPEQLARMARLLTVISTKSNRLTDGLPDWLTVLANDIVMAQIDDSPEKFVKHTASCTPHRLAEVLLADDPDAQQVSVAVITVIFQADLDGYYRRMPHELPGVAEYLAQFGAEFSGAAAAKLRAPGRVALIEKAQTHPPALDALAPTVAALCADSAKTVRQAAITALATLPQARQTAVLTPVLAKVAASRGGDLVEYLGRSAEGLELLNQAVTDGAKIAALVTKAAQRQEVLTSGGDDAEIVLPPYEPLPSSEAGEQVAIELRRWLAKEIAAGEDSEEKWHKDRAARASRINQADLDTLLAIANGTSTATTSKIMKTYSLWTVASAAPSLTLAQVLRLEMADAKSRSWAWAAGFRVEEGTDLRAIVDVCTSLDIPSDWVGGLLSTVGTQAAWPWFSQHLEIIQKWLTESNSTATSALWLLEAFPRVPDSLLPSVAALAMGDSKTNRPLAQGLLSTHPSALSLARQGLTDGKAEIRIGAATWLGKIGDTAGVEALTAALAKERREAVRAALLTALESLGVDISEHLSSKILLAEATKGLKAKPPASMSWFLDLGLPAARWANESPVEPQILRWWTILATKLKNPDGSGLLDRYLSLLNPEDAAAVSSLILRAWIAQDTRHPDPAESRAHAEAMAPQRYKSNQEWLARARAEKNNNWLHYAEEAAAVPVEKHYADAYREHQSQYLGSAAAEKGLLALTTRMPGIELANAVAAYIRNDGSRRAQVEYLVHTLYANGDPAAIQLLLSIARRHKQATVQAKALELVERLAEDRGWSADELADRTIPTAGFSEDRLLHLNFGSREFLGRITTKATIELSDAGGNPLKALPNPRQDDDAELVAAAKKQLTTSRKELKAVLGLQTGRLYEAMCAQRSWSAPDWQEFLAGHSLVAGLVSRLVWLETDGDSVRSFRSTEDGTLIDVNDEPVDLAGQSRISLAHQVLLPEAEVDAWRQHLTDYEVSAPFEQFNTTTPELPSETKEITDLAGHLTDTFKFRTVATKRGYTRGQAEDAGWFSEYTKTFAGLKLTAVIEFTGSYLPEENITCATEKLYFRRGRRQVSIGEIPPILVAECYADYAALAALGPYDSDYRKKAEY
jgi:hypothetical protein